MPIIPDDQKKSKKDPPPQDTDYQVYVNDEPFSIKVFRKSTGRLMLDF